jgi:hypothetical protein
MRCSCRGCLRGRGCLWISTKITRDLCRSWRKRRVGCWWIRKIGNKVAMGFVSSTSITATTEGIIKLWFLTKIASIAFFVLRIFAIELGPQVLNKRKQSEHTWLP